VLPGSPFTVAVSAGPPTAEGSFIIDADSHGSVTAGDRLSLKVQLQDAHGNAAPASLNDELSARLLTPSDVAAVAAAAANRHTRASRTSIFPTSAAAPHAPARHNSAASPDRRGSTSPARRNSVTAVAVASATGDTDANHKHELTRQRTFGRMSHASLHDHDKEPAGLALAIKQVNAQQLDGKADQRRGNARANGRRDSNAQKLQKAEKQPKSEKEPKAEKQQPKVAQYEIATPSELTVMGRHVVHIKLNGVAVKGSPLEFELVPAAPIASKSRAFLANSDGLVIGTPIEVCLQLVDKYGNDLKARAGGRWGAGVRVDAKAFGSKASECTVVDRENGTFSITFTASVAGDYKMAVRLENVEMSALPLKVEALDGATRLDDGASAPTAAGQEPKPLSHPLTKGAEAPAPSGHDAQSHGQDAATALAGVEGAPDELHAADAASSEPAAVELLPSQTVEGFGSLGEGASAAPGDGTAKPASPKKKTNVKMKGTPVSGSSPKAASLKSKGDDSDKAPGSRRK
jgi:hypothetical protein